MIAAATREMKGCAQMLRAGNASANIDFLKLRSKIN